MEKRKSKEKCVKRHADSVSSGQDMISMLHNDLISKILLHLPTKDVVRTSVLSNRWKRVWVSIPELDLDTNEFPDYNSFVSFMNRFLDIYSVEKSCLDKLKLSIRRNESDESFVMRWIDFVARRKLKHLDVECLVVDRRESLEVMPISLYVSDTLLYLRLHQVFVASFESNISLPCVKTMCLESNVYANGACLESLISSCPLLEDVSIVRRENDNVEVLRVRSKTLNRLSVEFSDKDRGSDSWEHLIDAPRLESITIYSLGSLADVNIAGLFMINDLSEEFGIPKNQMSRDFLTSISRVRDMIISAKAMVFFCSYMNVEPLPQFWKLSSLEATFSTLDLNFLPKFLERCPNLKSIVLGLTFPAKSIPAIRLSSVPQCLSSSLEFVEIKSKFMATPIEMKVARYFVQNSALLKKLVVHLSYCMREQSMGVLTDLLALPRPSSHMCEIIFAD